MTIDLRNASYEEFVSFVFDHYPTPEDDVDELWYWNLERHFNNIATSWQSLCGRSVADHLLPFAGATSKLAFRVRLRRLACS